MSNFDYVLGLSDFSSGTVYFAGSASTFAIRKGGYTPRVAPPDETTVEETIVVRLTGGSAPANLASLRTAQRLLLQASRRAGNKTLPRVFVFFKEHASATQYRSEITNGYAEWDSSALDWEYWTQQTQYAEINWTRGNWWEGPEAQLALTNPNGTATTSGLKVYNVNDLVGSSPNKRVNYVAITGTDVQGDLDGLTRIEIKNTYSTNLLYHIWIGHSYTNPATLTHFFDANSATHSGGTATSDAASGGNYVTVNLVSGTEADLLTWNLTSAQLDAFAGRWYKAMMRWFLTVGTAVRYRIRLKWKNSAIWESGLVSLSGAVYATIIRELATLKLPPWVAGLTNQDPISLVLRGYHTAGGTVAIAMDSMQMIPVDGWRQIAYVGYGGTLNHRVIDDGINGRLYEDNNAGGSIVGNLTSYGQPIALRPGKNQRLYIQTHSNVAESGPIDRTAEIKVYYRPRRRSL